MMTINPYSGNPQFDPLSSSQTTPNSQDLASKNNNINFSLVPTSPKAPRVLAPSIINIIKILQSPSKLGSQYKGLDLNFKLMKAESIEKTIPIDRETQNSLYNALKTKFQEIEFNEDSNSWQQKADLLDAIDTFIEIFPEYEPLKMRPNPNNYSITWNYDSVALVPYENIEKATSQIAKATNTIAEKTISSLSDMGEHLKGVVTKENSSIAKVIRHVSKRGIVASSLNALWRNITLYLGYKKSKNYKIPIQAIIKNSMDLGIKSFEILCKKTYDKTQDVFYYRGPKFLFGKSIYDYKNVNEWFTRDLTPAARKEYLVKSEHEKKLLENSFGSLEGIAPVVISNSDCRLRISKVDPQKFGKLQELTGKVLNDESAHQAETNKDDAVYYEKKYKFSAKNLLGRTLTDEVNPMLLNKEGVAHLHQEAKKSPNHSALVTEEKKRILTSAGVQNTIIQAQHELLGGIYRLFNEEGAVQVIQRLAPADVHNYVFPLEGTPLSHKEAVSYLRKRIEAKSSTSTKESTDVLKEIDYLKELEQVFTDQETILGRPSQPTIDIYGTNASVSTSAIKERSSILSQNDRKVMLYQHEDGNCSLHVFIGATGVNRVNVNPLTSNIPQQQGNREGDMGFGSDYYQETDLLFAAGDTETRDAGRKLKIGERSGGFPINGSTVISYYLPSDFKIKTELEAYKEKGVYGTGKERTEIEIIANMGDPLLVKTEIVFAQFIEKHFPNIFNDNTATGKSLLKEFALTECPQSATPQEIAMDADIRKILSGSLPTETTARKTLEKLLNQRLEKIRKVSENLASEKPNVETSSPPLNFSPRERTLLSYLDRLIAE